MTPRERLELLSALNRTRDRATHGMVSWKCGSTCCVVGFGATHVPELTADGLMVVPNRAGSYALRCGSRTDWDAVKYFFGLDCATAEYLFSDDAYCESPSPEEVSDRIDQYLKEHPCETS